MSPLKALYSLTLFPVPWADLGVLDLSKASTAEGRAELAATARDALHNIGFFYVINHGLSQNQVYCSIAWWEK